MDAFDLKELDGAPIRTVPWYFRLGRFMARNKIRGGDRLVASARRLGLLDHLVVYPLGNEVQLRVPLWRPCNSWDEADVLRYEASFMRALATAIGELSPGATFIDCGADIGTVTAHIVARCPNVESVIAFEPNRAAYAVLAQNLTALAVRSDARNAAVGDFCGRGRLMSSALDRSAHAAYVVPAPDGPIRVERIDDLAIPAGRPCAIKIDVEGGERDVVAGATRTIANAGDLLVAFEAHPKVARRTCQDPVEVMRHLVASGRELAFVVDTDPLGVVDPDRPFFDQLPPTRVYNVIALSLVA